jgi:hypothetical protein
MDAHFSMHGVQAQNYHIMTPYEGKDWAMAWGCQPWDKELPWANHAQNYTFRPGQSGHYILEFYITPFDYAGCEGPQRAVESEALREQAHRPLLGRHRLRRWQSRRQEQRLLEPLARAHHVWQRNLLREFRLMPLEPQFRKPIEARWSFKVIDMNRRLVAFQDESEGQITSWKWDFGDHTDSSDQFPIHQYKAAGEYVVVLYVEGPAGKSRLSKIWDVVIR